MRPKVRWCPSGKCGKKVYFYTYKNVKGVRTSIFLCDKCGKEYTKQEMIDAGEF